MQARTATFQSGLAEAAKSARGSFGEIGSGAREAGGAVGYSMMEARHSVMILGEEFGIKIPRALAGFVASLGPIGPALEAAFPFMAIALAASLLLEHLAKMREAGEKLTTDQVAFETAANNAFNSLDQKLLQAQIRMDELRNDHAGALKLQLDLIDKQSMGELVHQFEELDKAAQTVMKDLESHWYTFGQGSDGAKHALATFTSQYEYLMSLGTDSGKQQATNLLAGTLKTAQDILAAQQTIKANRDSGDGQTDANDAAERLLVAHEASLTVSEDEVAAQAEIVSALRRQVGMTERLSAIQKIDKDVAKKQSGNEEAARRAAAARAAIESQQRMAEQSLTADRATANASLDVHQASLEERLQSDIDFAGRERDVKEATNQAEIAALDKSGKDYQNQLKALQEKTLEINAEFDAKVAELKAKSSVDVYDRDLRALEQSERGKIETTQQGSMARLAAIDSAIKQEEARGLQETQFYRDLLNQRVQATRQEAEEEGRLRQEAGKEDADNFQKMGEMGLAAEKQRYAVLDSLRRVSRQQQIDEDTKLANAEFAIKMVALQKEAAALDANAKDHENKLKAIQDKEKQLLVQHENEITSIKEKAEAERNATIKNAEQAFQNAIASQLTQSIMGHQTWAKTLINLGDQVVSGMIENALKSNVAEDLTRTKDAASAARWAFTSTMRNLPFPANIIAAPIAGAAAFTSVMAFKDGTERVPGSGAGDIVPTMLEPGEGVVPGGVMDGLRTMARNGGLNQGPRNHVVMHVNMQGSALDSDGMDKVLSKHGDKLRKHFESTLRKMNR